MRVPSSQHWRTIAEKVYAPDPSRESFSFGKPLFSKGEYDGKPGKYKAACAEQLCLPFALISFKKRDKQKLTSIARIFFLLYQLTTDKK